MIASRSMFSISPEDQTDHDARQAIQAVVIGNGFRNHHSVRYPAEPSDGRRCAGCISQRVEDADEPAMSVEAEFDGCVELRVIQTIGGNDADGNGHLPDLHRLPEGRARRQLTLHFKVT